MHLHKSTKALNIYIYIYGGVPLDQAVIPSSCRFSPSLLVFFPSPFFFVLIPEPSCLRASQEWSYRRIQDFSFGRIFEHSLLVISRKRAREREEKTRDHGTIEERIVSIRITLSMRYDVLLLVTLIELCTFSSRIGKFPRTLADVFRAWENTKNESSSWQDQTRDSLIILRYG